MRVLITTSTFPHRLDEGLPRFVNDLAQALAERMEVTVLAPDSPGAARVERVGDVDVRRFSYFRPRGSQRLALGQGMRDNLRASWLARLQVPGYVVRQAAATRRMIATGEFDLVFAHWIVPQGLTAAWAVGRSRRVPLVLHVHGGDAYLLRELPRARRIARYVVSRSDAVFASGSGVRDRLDEVLGFESNAVIRPMGVDTHVFRGADDAPLHGSGSIEEGAVYQDGFLLFVGRLIEIKGLLYLIRSMPMVLERYPGMGLVVIGDGPERSRVEREIDRLDVGPSVRVLGRRPHQDVVRYLRGCRAAIIPSIVDDAGRTEGMPTTVIEALAAGCRVVASAVGGIPDIIRHGENGWLCPDRDPEALAAAILNALDRSDPRFTEEIRATADAHDWRAVAAQYGSCFEDVLERSADR